MKKILSLSALVLGSSFLFQACTGTDAAEKTVENKMEKAPRIDLKDFFKNPEKSSYQISPQGSYYSFMAPYESRMNVFVQKIGETEAKRLTDVTDRDIAGYTWASDDRILYLKDNGGDENFGLYGVNVDGSNNKPLTAFEGVRTQLIDDLEGLDDFVMVGLNKRDARIFDPYRLNIQTGDLEMLYENPGNISGWMTDHEGNLRIAITTDGVNTSLLYRDSEKDDFKSILTTDFTESLSPEFFTFDNKNLYVTSNLDRDKSVAGIFDIESGTLTEVLFEHPEVDVSGMTFSKKRQELTTIYYSTDKRYRHFVSDITKNLFVDLESQLPGYELGITSVTEEEDKMIVRTYSDKSLGAYYLYDVASKEVTKIEDVSPWLDENQMANQQPVSYKSRDGLTINGYLTLPKGVEAKNLPLVVNPHGGPWVRDSWGFNPEVQFLANRGYAVLQMNYRGSTGYGKEFWKSSFKQWGQKMQDDITDGVNYLIEQGIADKERVAIYGASYGGYATLAGLTFTPEVYACGVDYVGVSNLFTFMETIPPYWEQYLDMMYEMVGNPKEDSAMMAAFSPSLNADKIQVPLFIAQGANDPRVKKSESDQMVEALKSRGITVDYMVKNNEGHGFRNEENQFDFYQKMEDFLAQHIGDTSVKTEMEEVKK